MTKIKYIIIQFIVFAFIYNNIYSQNNRIVIDSLLMQINKVSEKEQIDIYN